MRNDNKMGEQIRRQIRLRYRVTISLFLVPVAAILWNVADPVRRGKGLAGIGQKATLETSKWQPTGQYLFQRWTTNGQYRTIICVVHGLSSGQARHLFITPTLVQSIGRILGDKSSSAYRNHLMKGYQTPREYLITSMCVSHTELRAIQTFPCV